MFPLAEIKAMQLLKNGSALTKYDLAKVMPCHLMSALRVLKNLHAKHEDVCIDHWVLINHQPIPAYKLKRGPDAPRPQPKGKR